MAEQFHRCLLPDALDDQGPECHPDVLAAVHGEVQVEGLGMDLDPLSARCLLVNGDGWPLVEVE